MKKSILIILTVILIVAFGVLLYFWNQYLAKSDPEKLCRASNGGWAPAFMDSGELQTCDGEPLDKDSPLIDYEGYTCYCHTENTCWNGQACVSVKK